MAIATKTGGGNEWRIDDAIIQLRAWGGAVVSALPSAATGEWLIGADAGCAIKLVDPEGRVSRQHARLTREGEHWLVTDLRSKNGLFQDGARRLSFPLTPGIEIGLGGLTLIAESPRLIALRAVLSRLIGWSDARAADVDLALRAVRMTATRRDSLLLCGDGDLVSVAQLLHRHALGDAKPFVVCDPRRRRADPNARAAANYSMGLPALAAATGGTLCVWQNRQPSDFGQVIAGLREPSARVQLVVCTHTLHSSEPLIALPIVFPAIAERHGELDRIIDEYAVEAVANLERQASDFTAADRRWIVNHESGSLAEIEKATRRLVAIRGAGGSITRAATQLGMSHAALSEWVARRTLPE